MWLYVRLLHVHVLLVFVLYLYMFSPRLFNTCSCFLHVCYIPVHVLLCSSGTRMLCIILPCSVCYMYIVCSLYTWMRFGLVCFIPVHVSSVIVQYLYVICPCSFYTCTCFAVFVWYIPEWCTCFCHAQFVTCKLYVFCPCSLYTWMCFDRVCFIHTCTCFVRVRSHMYVFCPLCFIPAHVLGLFVLYQYMFVRVRYKPDLHVFCPFSFHTIPVYVFAVFIAKLKMFWLCSFVTWKCSGVHRFIPIRVLPLFVCYL